jgi:hypothetical protein
MGGTAVRRVLMASFVLSVAAAFAWAGGDPWKSKPFQQWDEKDVRKILGDSPWSKIVQVPAAWKTGGDAGGVPDPPTASATQEHSPDGGIMGQRNAGSAPAAPQVPQATFVVRWVSARTVREAVLRGAVLGGRMKEEDAERQASQPVEVYQVLIVGQDMKPFQDAGEKALTEKTYLVMKKTKQKVAAVGVEFQRGPDGKTVQAIAFAFPRRTAGGEETIAPDEKNVEFYSSVAGANIRASFDIPKMEDAKGRDL